MEVCPKCQNSFPAYQMFAHNLECEMPLPIQDLESKCDFCQLDFSNHLLEEHLSQCEAKHQIDFQAKAQQDQLQQIQSQQYTQPLQNTNQQNILDANMKQESERNNVVQQVPRKKKIIIKEVEYQTPLEEQRKFQQNQQQQEWQKYRQQKQQQIYQQQQYQIQEQQQIQPQQLQRNQYQQCQQEHCQYQMQQQQFQQEQYQYQMQQQQQYQYQMEQQQQYQYQMEQQQQQQLQQQQQIIFQPSVVQQLQKSLEFIYQQKQQQQQQQPQPQITCIGFQNQPLQQSQPYKQYNQPLIQQSVRAIQPQSVQLKKQKKNKLIGIKDFSNWSVYYFKRSPVLDESYLSCVICLLDYQEDDNIVLLQCTHRFHEKCLIEWSNKNSSCPLCNLDVL